MKPITNVYILADTSAYMSPYAAKLQSILIKTKRALSLLKENTKLHIISFNDRTGIYNPSQFPHHYGEPNFGEALKFLYYILKISDSQPHTRSVFILHSSGNVLRNWQYPLKALFKREDFACGLRYVVTYGKPDCFTKRAFTEFTENHKRILHYFSENRLCSLVKQINSKNFI